MANQTAMAAALADLACRNDHAQRRAGPPPTTCVQHRVAGEDLARAIVNEPDFVPLLMRLLHEPDPGHLEPSPPGGSTP
jgi:hypothetical protein